MGFRLKVYILLACKLLFLYKRINCRKTAKERVFKQQGFIASFAAASHIIENQEMATRMKNCSFYYTNLLLNIKYFRPLVTAFLT